jgi:small conductance mechanosensitive channel
MGIFRRKQERRELTRRMFETRSEAWHQAGLSFAVDRSDARRARIEVAVICALIAAVIVLFSRRGELFSGHTLAARIVTVALLVVLGWQLARALGRGIAPQLFRRMDPGTAGTMAFVIRLLTIAVVVVVALRFAGVRPEALAVGGAFTAVVLGLATQQTLGNVFAGVVLQGTRPFRVGERVRLTGGPLAGSVEGTVSSLGLFYASFVNGADRMMIPNNVLLQCAVVPLLEPERVDLRARVSADVSPSEVQERLRRAVTVPTRYPPDISLEEVDREEAVLRITATPEEPSDGARLAEQIVAATRSGNGVREHA